MPDDILVDYASPVELTTLTGLSTLPGGHVCVAGERILTYGEDDTNCGIWEVVDPGAWTRATDFDADTEVVFNQQIVPQNDDGSNGIQAGSVFYVATTGTITPGTTAFTIRHRIYEEVQTAGVGITKVGSDWQQSTTGVLAGSYDRVTVDERGNVSVGSSSESATTFIEGLRLVWLTTTSFRVEEGAAYINGTGSIVDLAVAVDVTAGTKGLPGTFVANTWYYVYLYSNGGIGDIEVSTQAPVTTAYRGGAREKGPDGTPDNTRRYLGAVYASSTTVLRKFQKSSDTFTRWVVDLITTARVVSASQATTSTDVDISAWCPPTSQDVEVNISLANTDNVSQFYVTAAGDGLQTSGGSVDAGQLSVSTNPTTGARQHLTGPIALFGGTRSLRYRQSAVGASRTGNIDMIGFWERR